MNKVKWLVLLLAGVVVAASAHAQGDPFAPYRAICEIRTGGGQGSGTLIAINEQYGLVLSCRHVCEKEGESVSLTWLSAGKQRGVGTIWKVLDGKDWGTDQALVICPRPEGVAPRPVSKADIKQSPFIAAGYRDGYLRTAVVNSFVSAGNTITIPKPAVGGMSGGPLFDRRGHVVGIVVASDMTTITIASNGKALTDMLEEFKKTTQSGTFSLE